VMRRPKPALMPAVDWRATVGPWRAAGAAGAPAAVKHRRRGNVTFVTTAPLADRAAPAWDLRFEWPCGNGEALRVSRVVPQMPRVPGIHEPSSPTG
jgi:hypothetical protein